MDSDAPTATRANDGGFLSYFTNAISTGFGLFADPEAPMLPGEEQAYESAQTYDSTYEGKNVIVTGASGAVGQQIACKLIDARVKNLVLFVRSWPRFVSEMGQNKYVLMRLGDIAQPG
jgi:cation diffusion facilitator CzcD-associated flavoprotein CzcO